MIKFKKTKKAVTLLELVIVLSLMSLVTMLVFNFTSLTQKQEKELDIKQQLQHDGSMITESMMKNVMQCKSIEEVTPAIANATGDEKNKIKSIKINFNGLGEVKGNPAAVNLSMLEYKLDGNALKLVGHKRKNPTSEIDLSTEEIAIQTVAENVETVKIVNKNITDKLANPSVTLESTDVENLLKDEKGINLEIKLKEKEIVHLVTIDLNLRNSN